MTTQVVLPALGPASTSTADSGGAEIHSPRSPVARYAPAPADSARPCKPPTDLTGNPTGLADRDRTQREIRVRRSGRPYSHPIAALSRDITAKP